MTFVRQKHGPYPKNVSNEYRFEAAMYNYRAFTYIDILESHHTIENSLLWVIDSGNFH